MLWDVIILAKYSALTASALLTDIRSAISFMLGPFGTLTECTVNNNNNNKIIHTNLLHRHIVTSHGYKTLGVLLTVYAASLKGFPLRPLCRDWTLAGVTAHLQPRGAI